MTSSTFKAACVAAALLLVSAPLSRVAAQDDDHFATFGVSAGAFSPRTTFTDPSFGDSHFESAAVLAASATAWPHPKIGIGIDVTRTKTNGANETSEFAPLAVNDPTQWTFTTELIGRYGFELGAVDINPYLSAGVGLRHYTWHAAIRDESMFLTMTGSLGMEIRPAAFGPFGFTAEVRGYRSQFDAFGVNGGNWRPGTPARPVDPATGTDIGFYGGVVDKVWSHDVLFLVGIAFNY